MKFTKLFTNFLMVSLWCIVTSQSGEELEEIEGNKERLEKLQTAGIALATSFAAVLGVTNPIAGTVVAVGLAVLVPILEAIQEEQDIWDQMESKVDQRIGKKLSESEISGYRDLLFDFNKRIKKGARFSMGDLDFIIGKMEAVIPFDHTLGWNYELPFMMLLYVPYLIAGYQEILKKDKDLPVCELANDMNLYRSKVILGCKEMMKKRYKMIAADTSKTEYHKYTPKKRRRILRSVNKKNTSFITLKSRLNFKPVRDMPMYFQIYKDNVNGNIYQMRKFLGKPYNETWEEMIEKRVQRPTVDFLFNNIIAKINKYFTSDICLRTQFNCKCPEPIRRYEINFGWPKKCYGLDTCLFPAGKFGETYTWCYEKGSRKSWQKCDRIDLDTCMSVNRPKVKPLNVLKRNGE